MTPTVRGVISRLADSQAWRWDGLTEACGRRPVAARFAVDVTASFQARLATEVGRGDMDRVTRVQVRLVADGFSRLSLLTGRIALGVQAVAPPGEATASRDASVVPGVNHDGGR